jgi:hypothetical protein
MSIAADDHKNDKKTYRLCDGTPVSNWQLKQLFMGKIPGPVHRKLLGIEKITR